MIDLILIAAFVGIFYGGFKAGNSFKTIAEMLEAGLKSFK